MLDNCLGNTYGTEHGTLTVQQDLNDRSCHLHGCQAWVSSILRVQFGLKDEALPPWRYTIDIQT